MVEFQNVTNQWIKLMLYKLAKYLVSLVEKAGTFGYDKRKQT